MLCFSLYGEGINDRQINSKQVAGYLSLDFSNNTEQFDDTKPIPPNPYRNLANAFQHSTQLNPDYVVLMEFLPEDWSARLYKHLIDSGELEPWYIQSSFSAGRQRLAGWKDSNLMYKTGLILPV